MCLATLGLCIAGKTYYDMICYKSPVPDSEDSLTNVVVEEPENSTTSGSTESRDSEEIRGSSEQNSGASTGAGESNATNLGEGATLRKRTPPSSTSGD